MGFTVPVYIHKCLKTGVSHASLLPDEDACIKTEKTCCVSKLNETEVCLKNKSCCQLQTNYIHFKKQHIPKITSSTISIAPVETFSLSLKELYAPEENISFLESFQKNVSPKDHLISLMVFRI